MTLCNHTDSFVVDDAGNKQYCGNCYLAGFDHGVKVAHDEALKDLGVVTGVDAEAFYKSTGLKPDED